MGKVDLHIPYVRIESLEEGIKIDVMAGDLDGAIKQFNTQVEIAKQNGYEFENKGARMERGYIKEQRVLKEWHPT